jgi:hypothetical protein
VLRSAIVGFFLGFIGLVASCSEALIQERCTSIPAGGCPLARGRACEDPSCEAVYLCRPNNVWVLEQQCPPRAPREAAAPIATEEDAEVVPRDASIDAPPGAFGGPGCASLQAPDCSLGLALSCGDDCCGCSDLFVCENGAWSLWGACGDAGPAPGR